MRVSLQLLGGLALGAALGLSLGCAKKPAPRADASAALPDLPEPAGLLGEFGVAHPEATFRALRELGRPYSSLLPAGFPLLVSTLLGLPPLSADSFDPELQVVGALLQAAPSEPGWVLAVHAVSGPELVAKLCTGAGAPFRAASHGSLGLKLLERSTPVGAQPTPALALAVFDHYLLVSNSREILIAAGPYVARVLPRRPAPKVPIALRFGQRALEMNVVPAARAWWASYRTRLTHLDQTDRSAHGGRAPDFADPAQVILGADALLESLLSMLDSARSLELDLEPSAERLDATLLLEPEAGSNVQLKLSELPAGDAQGLLTLPFETRFALGLTRSAAERAAAGIAAGEDWVRLLGARLSERDARALRAVLADWELGRGSLTRYGFLGGGEPGAFLATDVADAPRLKRAASGWFGLLTLPGLRAPLVEFLGQPSVSDSPAPADALPHVFRKKLSFSASAGRQPSLQSLGFAWLVEDSRGFAAASKNADRVLKTVVESARGQHPTLAAIPTLTASVQRMGGQAPLFAYADARSLLGAGAAAETAPAPLLLALGKRETLGYLRLEIAHEAVDLALQSALRQ